MSLLTIIQNAHKRLGLNTPSSAFTSPDIQVAQFVALAQQEGKELATRHPWSILTKEKTFTGVATPDQTSAIPIDFDRFVDESFWNRTQKRPVFGPISAQDWQQIQSSVATTVRESFRVRGSDILITPTPNGTDTYAYEYIKNTWCQSNAAVGQTTWLADPDTGLLSEELMTLGVIWRFLRAKGFDYAEAFRNYELQVADKFIRDGGRRRLNFGRRGIRGARTPYVPEGSWSI